MGTLESARLPEVFTAADALATGVPESLLYRWRDAGEIEVLARGIYTLPGFLGDPDLTEVAVRAPLATICLTSALARHGLSDDVPASIDAALPRTQRSPRTAAAVTWHRFDEATFKVGRERLVVTDDLSVGIYNEERSICDAYRLRHLYGDDQANEALRRYVRRKGAKPSALLNVARRFPAAEPVIRRALSILL